jgi:UDP-N-acetyl-D-galactosamine dehydrogenase
MELNVDDCMRRLESGDTPVAVVGLGYVGLPLAVALAGHFRVVGFDISDKRVAELRDGKDRTREVAPADLAAADIEYTTDAARLRDCLVVVVAVPTPIDGNRQPDLRPIRGASQTVGENLSPGTVVVFESTVYPGLTEEVCGPIMDQASGLSAGQDYLLGYSPERINPGDKVHTLRSIVKVVAGQTPQAAELLDRFYSTVVEAGVHRASSIRVAEAAKVIENTQRDINIALMNELSLIFERMGIDTLDVLEASGTKWNFLPFRPGLVGGHCIGVDPYYLTHKAEALGYHPQIILSGRRINDGMGKHVAESCIKLLIRNGGMVNGTRVGVLGLTFKENVPDLRNTRVTDIVKELADYGCEVLVSDPQCDPDEAECECGLRLTPLEELCGLDALILAVPHSDFETLDGERLAALYKPDRPRVLMDLKGTLEPVRLRDMDFRLWRL